MKSKYYNNMDKAINNNTKTAGEVAVKMSKAEQWEHAQGWPVDGPPSPGSIYLIECAGACGRDVLVKAEDLELVRLFGCHCPSCLEKKEKEQVEKMKGIDETRKSWIESNES